MTAENIVPLFELARDFPHLGKKPTPLARVLVIDDERLVRWAVAETLTALGYDVVEGGDARSAMQEISTGEPVDLVLLDLHLPDADDLRVLAWIRKQAPTLPVIVMTAFATREIVEQAAALGATVFAKPFDLDDLARNVEHALSGRVY